MVPGWRIYQEIYSEAGESSSAPKLLNKDHAAAAATTPSPMIVSHLYSPDLLTYLDVAKGFMGVYARRDVETWSPAVRVGKEIAFDVCQVQYIWRARHFYGTYRALAFSVTHAAAFSDSSSQFILLASTPKAFANNPSACAISMSTSIGSPRPRPRVCVRKPRSYLDFSFLSYRTWNASEMCVNLAWASGLLFLSGCHCRACDSEEVFCGPATKGKVQWVKTGQCEPTYTS